MDNFQLQNNEKRTFRATAVNAAGVKQPIPVGEKLTLTVSDPSKLNAVLGADAAGNQTISVNPLVRAATGIKVTLIGSSGLAPAERVFDIVGDAKPTGFMIDLDDSTTVPQAVPEN